MAQTRRRFTPAIEKGRKERTVSIEKMSRQHQSYIDKVGGNIPIRFTQRYKSSFKFLKLLLWQLALPP